MRRIFILGVLAICSCANPNESKFTFKNYNDYLSSGSSLDGWIPQGVIPPSATNIRVTTNVDLNVAYAQFSIDRPDSEKVVRGFFGIGGRQLARLVDKGIIRVAQKEGATLSARCSVDDVEFVQLVGEVQVEYWNTRDTSVRELVCAKKPLR